MRRPDPKIVRWGILIALLVTGVLGRFVTPFILAGIQMLPGSEVVLRLFFS